VYIDQLNLKKEKKMNKPHYKIMVRIWG
jgi:hypothetical protein